LIMISAAGKTASAPAVAVAINATVALRPARQAR